MHSCLGTQLPQHSQQVQLPVAWNLSNPDTSGAKFSEVYTFQRLKYMQEWYYTWGGRGVLISGVSLWRASSV